VGRVEVTLAKRICSLVPCDDGGRPRLAFRKGGMDVDFIEAIANHLANDGADEVWLRLPSNNHTFAKGSARRTARPQSVASVRRVNALYGPLSVLERRIFVPLVAWAHAPSPADARLLLGFGADRVVIDAHLGLPDPAGFLARVVKTTGPDRVTAALTVRRFVGDKGVLWELVDGQGEGTGHDAILLSQRLASVGVSELLLVSSVLAPQSERLVHDGELIEQVSSVSSIPVLSTGDDRELADLATPLLMGADGVVTSLFSTGEPTVALGKTALLEFGLALRPSEG
jgi:imidazole glycerol phosphate synthase subunit HisF